MEMEGNLEEIFDLKPIVPEIYSTNLQQFSNSNNKFQPEQMITTTNSHNKNKHLMMNSISSTTWNSCRNTPHQEMIITKRPLCPPPPPPPTTAANCQLISFENNSPSDSDKLIIDQMAKDYNICNMTPGIITFSSLGTASEDQENHHVIDELYDDAANKRVCTASRTPSQAQEHLVAERKRREKLGQLFISLSKVVPGLKKLDKASLLEDAISHLKSLQERVKFLEEEEVNIKRNSINTASKDIEEESSINNNSNGSTSGESAAPEIKARISNRHVLIKICCRKQMGIMSRIPCEMEKMNLSVIDMRLMPFGEAALDITILAEMHSEFGGTVKDIVDHLQMVFLNPRT